MDMEKEFSDPWEAILFAQQLEAKGIQSEIDFKCLSPGEYLFLVVWKEA